MNMTITIERPEFSDFYKEITSFGFDFSAGDTINMGSGTYKVMAVVFQPDSHNVGRLILKKKGGRVLYQSYIRKNNGLLSPVCRLLYNSVEEATISLERHGAIINPDVKIV